MIYIRKSNERGHSQIGWLDSRHTFSFGDYQDADFMGFRRLRVINEDVVQPGEGFGKHSHRNMEIISYVINGELAHQDNLGTGSIIKPGDIQRMSAGTRVEHSEFNHSVDVPVHFLQIWIIPEKEGIAPSYEQKAISKKENEFILIGSSDGGEGSVVIHQDVKLFVGYLTPSAVLQYELGEGRYGWMQVVRGKVLVNGEEMAAGDGAGISDERDVRIVGNESAEVLFFDLN